MEYDKEFEGWFGSWWISGDSSSTRLAKDAAWYAWQAARKDHYRIGEEVEARAHSQESFVRGVVTALISVGREVVQPFNVRRIPAKSRIDEIAEEAVDKYKRGAVNAGDLKDIIKTAILQARNECEAER